MRAEPPTRERDFYDLLCRCRGRHPRHRHRVQSFAVAVFMAVSLTPGITAVNTFGSKPVLSSR
jgi:hypothetical protein